MFGLTSKALAPAALRVAPAALGKAAVSKRWLALHEYQSKHLLEKHGVNVSRGDVANNLDEVRKVANQLKDTGAIDLVLKSQILAGGRGKGTLSSGMKGGVKVLKSVNDVMDSAKNMLGYRLVTHQTTEDGELVER
eukprot:Trichotokara_eunicae@DN7104_c0_g1_i1.p1